MTSPRRRDDGFFRAVFSHALMMDGFLAFARRFLLPDLEAELSAEEQLPDGFVTPAMGERRSDCVWRVRAEGADGSRCRMHVHLEFQSACPREMPIRMLSYQDLLRQKLVSLEGPFDADGHAHSILSAVIHNGPRPWAAPLRMADLAPPILRGLPQGHEDAYLMMDIQNLPEDWLEDTDNPFVLLLIQERARDPQEMCAAWLTAVRMLPGTPEGRSLKQWFGRRLLARLDALPESEKTEEIRNFLKIREDSPMFEEKVEDLAGMFQKRLDESRAEGIIEGALKNALKNARNFLDMGLDPASVAKGTGLPLADVERLAAEMR